MSSARRWQSVEPEPGPHRTVEPVPAPAAVNAEPLETAAPVEPVARDEPVEAAAREVDVDVDLAAAEGRPEHRRAPAADGTVEIEAVLTAEEYQQLVAAAAEAGKTANDFLRQAVRDAWFFRRNAPPGSKILIVSGGKVHTVK